MRLYYARQAVRPLRAVRLRRQGTIVRISIKAATLAAVAAGTLVFGVHPASADSGDGLEACNRGEICVHEGQSSEQYRKHFWYNAIYYSSVKFYDSVTNQTTGLAVLNNVSSVRNRDTQCDIRLIDYGTNPDTSFVVANRPDATINQNIASQFGDRANEHIRVYCN